MPSPAKHFFHKDRPQALLRVQDPNQTRPPQASPTNDSPLPSPAYSSPYSTSSATSLITTNASTPREGDQDYRFHPSNVRNESIRYQSTVPRRSQSLRAPQPPPPPTPAHYLPQPPTTHTTATARATAPPTATATATATAISTHPSRLSQSFADGEGVPVAGEISPDFYYHQPPSSAAPKEDRKRRFLPRFGLSNKEPGNNSGGGVNAQTIGRNLSVRRKPTAPQISTENAGRPIQQRWSTAISTPTSAEEEFEGVDRVGVGLDSSRLPSRTIPPGPPLPEKDPTLASRPPPHQGFPVRGASLPSATAANPLLRPPLERQGSSNSSWGNNTVPVVPEYPSHPETHYHHYRPPSHLPSPASATSTSGVHPLLARRDPSEVFPPLPHEPNSRPSSQHSFAPPSPLQVNPGREDLHLPYRGSLPPPSHPPGSMGPPAQQLPQRSATNELLPPNQSGGTNNREGAAYQAYPPGSQGPNQASGPSPAQFGGQLGIHPPGANYRGGPQSSPMAPQPSNDAGRTSPSSRSYDDMMNMDVAQVVAKYYELRKLLFFYFLFSL